MSYAQSFSFLNKSRDEDEIKAFHKIKFGSVEEEDSQIVTSKIVMQQFSNFFNSYAKAINKKYCRKGTLFMDYVRRREVNENSYFTKLIHYIHFNPMHHGFCEYFYDWEFSSFKTFLSKKETKLEKEKVLEWFGDKERFILFHENTDFNLRESEIEEFEFKF